MEKKPDNLKSYLVCARWVGRCHSACVEVWRQLVGVGSLLPPGGFWGSNTDCQSRQKASTFSHWATSVVLRFLNIQIHPSSQKLRWLRKDHLKTRFSMGVKTYTSYFWEAILYEFSFLLNTIYLQLAHKVLLNKLKLLI